MKLDFLPKYDLTRDEKLWLNAIWNYTVTKLKYPSFRTIYSLLHEETGRDISPSNIPEDLLFDRGKQITLLGLFQIEDEAKIISLINQIFTYVQDSLKKDLEREDFDLGEIANSLNEEPNYIKTVFKLYSRYGRFWNSAYGESGLSVHNGFRVTDDDTFQFYRTFQSFEVELKKYFAKNENSLTDNYRNPIRDKGFFVKKDLIGKGDTYVDYQRVEQLEMLSSKQFDLSKLVMLCKELNENYRSSNFYSVALLCRAIIDHVPPIFGYSRFNEIANNYMSEGNSLSFKKSMDRLNKSLRVKGDMHLHSQVRKTEVLPTKIQVDFRSDFDILLAEVVRILK